MKATVCGGGVAFVLMLASASAFAQATFPIDAQQVTVCPGALSSDQPPALDHPDCSVADIADINPQHAHIWIRAAITVPAARLSRPEPLALWISGKAASRVFVNGQFVGANGVPAATGAEERPGLIDAALFVPHRIVVAGQNQVVLELSGHHSMVDLVRPMHHIAIGDYGDPADERLRHYWLSLLPFGALVLAALYLITLTISDRASWMGLLVPIMALLAAAQLVIEISRGVTSYVYPLHDMRLILILLCSLGFGLCLLSHVIWNFASRRQVWLLAIGAGLTMAAVLLAQGYDNKATAAILIPTVLAGALSGYRAIQRRPRSGQFAIALTLFASVMYLAPSQFLDQLFYYLTAGMMLFLSVHQALALAGERRLVAAERARADRLQMALDHRRESVQPQTLSITSAGKVEVVATDRIAYCKGAGDYVDIVFVDRGHVLHSGSLAKVEHALPATFLRVHRSYLVNTTLVQSLQREASGVGRLMLTNGAEVPVSRRVMPAVRKALTAAQTVPQT